MSFFDPAGVFGGGGGGGFRDPFGIFGGGRRQMSPQEIAQAQGGGGQSQRGNAFGGGFGGASGYRGQGMRESDFGGPAEMSAQAPQLQAQQQRMSEMGGPAPQAQPQWGAISNIGGGGSQGPQFQGLANALASQSQGKGPAQVGPSMRPMMQLGAGGSPYGQGGLVRGNGTVKGNPNFALPGQAGSPYQSNPVDPRQAAQLNRWLGRGPRG
jgi:hypothetical protein